MGGTSFYFYPRVMNVGENGTILSIIMICQIAITKRFVIVSVVAILSNCITIPMFEIDKHIAFGRNSPFLCLLRTNLFYLMLLPRFNRTMRHPKNDPSP